jgi:hypothetical protein
MCRHHDQVRVLAAGELGDDGRGIAYFNNLLDLWKVLEFML